MIKYKVLNLLTTEPLLLSINRGDQEVIFEISSITSKNKKESLKNPALFALLEQYIMFKGDNFETELYQNYLDVSDRLRNSFTEPLIPILTDPFTKITDMFDVMEITEWLKSTGAAYPPASLPDEYDESITKDGVGSRIQTYLKNDYMELLALNIAIKAVYSPIGEYASIHAEELGSDKKEYVVINTILESNLLKSPPAVKLKGLIEKILEGLSKDPIKNQIRIIEYRLPEEEIPVYMFSIILLRTMPAELVVNDNGDRNMITSVYNFCNNKLTNTSGVGNAIRNKVPRSQDGEGDESTIEVYRALSDVSMGKVEEYNFALSDAYAMAKHMGIENRDKELITILKAVNVFDRSPINDMHVLLAAWTLEWIIHPKSILHVNLTSIKNAVAVTALKMINEGFDDLAYYYLVIPQKQVDVTLQSTINRNRITKEISAELFELFPHNRKTKGDQEKSKVEGDINFVSDIMYKGIWQSILPRSMLGEKSDRIKLPKDLKIIISRYIIALEKWKEGSV